MTDRIIELAQVAGFTPAQVSIYQVQLQRFAELVLSDAGCGSGAGCLYKEARIAELEKKLHLARNAALDEAINACKEYAALPKVDSGVPLAIANQIGLLKEAAVWAKLGVTE